MSEPSKHGGTGTASSSGAGAGASGTSASGRAGLASIDFDVTAGFENESSAGAVDFIDITQDVGSGAASGMDILDVTGGATPPVSRSVLPPTAPQSNAGPATSGARTRALLAAIVIAALAAVIWFMMR